MDTIYIASDISAKAVLHDKKELIVYKHTLEEVCYNKFQVNLLDEEEDMDPIISDFIEEYRKTNKLPDTITIFFEESDEPVVELFRFRHRRQEMIYYIEGFASAIFKKIMRLEHLILDA
jgi:hypothetical protein